MIASVSRGGPVEQRRLAESQYKSAYTAVWRSAQVAEVRDVLATRPGVRGREIVEIPYRVDCFWAERD